MKAQRHNAILRLLREHAIPSQERLRHLLHREGFDVTQATLSRDIRELGLIKQNDADGGHHYAAPPEETVPLPSLAQGERLFAVELDPVGGARWRPFRPVLRDLSVRPARSRPSPMSGAAGAP